MSRPTTRPPPHALRSIDEIDTFSKKKTPPFLVRWHKHTNILHNYIYVHIYMRVPCTNSPFSLGVHNVRPLFSIGTTAQGFTFLLHPVIRKYMTILHNFTKLIDMRFSLFTCKADRKRLLFCGEERHEQKQHEQRDSSRGNFYAKPPPLEVQICRLAVFRGKRSGRQEMQLAQFQSKR